LNFYPHSSNIKNYELIGVILLNKRTNGCAIGIDIGGTKIMLFVSDGKGNIVEKSKLPTPPDSSPERLFSYLVEHLDESLLKAGWDRSKVGGMGIGLPGVINVHTGVADNCTALGWGAVDVIGEMKKHVDCPIFVDNDVNMSAIGEWWMGAAQDINEFYMLAIGTGIGSAIMAGGNLLRGSGYASGEIGYFVLDNQFPDELEQDYSTFGSLERMASGIAITERAREALKIAGVPTLLKESYGATPDNIRTEQVFQAAAEGDSLALEILRLPIRHLSMAIANAAALLNPERIVIGGGVADSGPLLLTMLQEQAEKLSPNPIKLVPAILGNEAGAAGALYMALQKNKLFQYDSEDGKESS
jgi:glucokinase